MTVRDYGTRKVRRSWVALAISMVAVVGTLWAMMFTGFDFMQFERENARLPPPSAEQVARYRPLAQAEWRIVHANLETRLNQTSPLELGAVWATRKGQICGLVNGRGSFGGLSSMVRFYTVDQRPVFHQDVDHILFQHAWFQCRRDPYVMLRAGTTEPGFCGSELGRRRCFKVKNGEPIG